MANYYAISENTSAPVPSIWPNTGELWCRVKELEAEIERLREAALTVIKDHHLPEDCEPECPVNRLREALNQEPFEERNPAGKKALHWMDKGYKGYTK